ncbi:MAG: Do family serine endopeptidase [Alphaproteobacteria bacterium]
MTTRLDGKTTQAVKTAVRDRDGQAAAWRSAALWLGLVTVVAALIWAGMAQARPAPDSFADLVEDLAPAVVNISTTQRVERRQNRRERRGGPEMPFDEFFREFFERGPMGRAPREPREVQSLGSGFVVDPRGYIVTNNHVVGDATDIQVNFASGLKLPAELVGKDEATDLAVIKVESDKPLPVVKFGNSDEARVGDWVMAIGNPFNLGTSVTAGIISARNRNIGAGVYDDFIQTDAAINRGNSGGPLFNMKGEVVGVNTVIISPSGGSVGIGFAISAALADNVIAQLIDYGETRRGWLGVQIQYLTDELASSFGLKEAKGAAVSEVVEGGPAEKAGFKIGDVILKFDGTEIEDHRMLSRTVAGTDIGKTVNVVVWRNKKEKVLKVKLGKLDPQVLNGGSSSGSGEVKEGEQELTALGVTVVPTSDPQAERFQVEEGVTGVLITDVDPDGPAAKSLRPGDVIVEVEQEQVASVSDVEAKVAEELKKKDDNLVLLLLNRRGQISFRAVRLEEDT